MPKRKWPPCIGDRVIVPFGGYQAEGMVTRVSSGKSRTWVTVVFQIDPDAEEPTMMTYLLDEIQPAEAA